MKFYTINIDYIKYLNSFDHEVYLNKKRHDYENKPYIGIIVFDNGINYFVPLTSAKQKHLKLKNTGKDYLIIYENITRDEIHKNDIYMELPNAQIKKLISVVDFRKAIPVPDDSFFEIDIRKHKDRDLLAKEYAFCASKKETIISKTKSVIRFQKTTGDVLFAYCNFNLLETKMLEWK
ncbi:MAG: type III toxin-antitoxin system ToxN/AbiQ family toxin [Erysipelotrichaceae bacterium]